MYAVERRNLEFAAMVLLGFSPSSGLRTGECLQVKPVDLMFGEEAAIVSLAHTKTGLLNAAREMVSFDDYMWQ